MPPIPPPTRRPPPHPDRRREQVVGYGDKLIPIGDRFDTIERRLDRVDRLVGVLILAVVAQVVFVGGPDVLGIIVRILQVNP